ncbi:hypothetical protein [Paraburkholderia sp. BCC1876]|uniref:hypothetical protein n=1 Tax=Paraburkholderia sp. BCC1876 TaxID=2676303 RepID=UPI0015904B4F|nr:hypothetical protein [Paraburkholderia sp. BCC1876]
MTDDEADPPVIGKKTTRRAGDLGRFAVCHGFDLDPRHTPRIARFVERGQADGGAASANVGIP